MGKKLKQIVRDIWDSIKWLNSQVTGVSEKENRENGMEEIFQEKMDKNIPKLIKDSRNSINLKKNKYKLKSRHIIIKLLKPKDKEKMYLKQLEKKRHYI